ncbi:MAG TPA: hypothetical protein VFT04_02905 [Gemmatimonadales bacterium]|nr:hypothetical protein [Gemmatimonadales bacterium]
MDTRFRSSDSTGTELPWQNVDELLDALEDGRLDAGDYVFDATRQAWQPIRKHSEIVAAWDRRMGYRPPGQRRVIANARRPAEGFPALSPEGETPVSTPAVSRIEAARRARRQPEEIPVVRSAFAVGEIGFVLVVLAMLGAGLVALARAFMGSVGGQ